MLIAAGVSDTLDGLRRTYAGLPDFLMHVVNAELARVPRHLSDALADQLWSMVYMPQVGWTKKFLPCVKCLCRPPEGKLNAMGDSSGQILTYLSNRPCYSGWQKAGYFAKNQGVQGRQFFCHSAGERHVTISCIEKFGGARQCCGNVCMYDEY